MQQETYQPGFPPDPLPIVIGCDDIEREITYLPCGISPPSNLMPPDGSVGIPLTPTLSWTWPTPTHCPGGLGVTIFSVLLGTAPDSLSQAGWTDTITYLSVGPLHPHTEYYWCVHVYDSAWECPGSTFATSPIQSFTTGGDVPTKRGSWGYIKTLYQ
jgi:hypothetical protein